MTSKNFEEIFQLIKDDITKENIKMRDQILSFVQVGRNRTHPIFPKLYHTNICTLRLYGFAILHSQTYLMIQVVSHKPFNVRPA